MISKFNRYDFLISKHLSEREEQIKCHHHYLFNFIYYYNIIIII